MKFPPELRLFQTQKGFPRGEAFCIGRADFDSARTQRFDGSRQALLNQARLLGGDSAQVRRGRRGHEHQRHGDE